MDKKEIKTVITAGKSQSLTLRVRQTVYPALMDGLLIGQRFGSPQCPMCGKQESARHLLAECPVAIYTWYNLATACRWKNWAHTWAKEIVRIGPYRAPEWGPGLRRTMLIGLRPEGERNLQEPFALMRGLTISAILAQRNAASQAKERAIAEGEGWDGVDHYWTATKIYSEVTQRFETGIHEERGQMRALEIA